MRQVRLPLEPLLDVCGTRNLKDVERRLGVSYRAVLRWSRTGLTWESADLAACRCGYHPALVWGLDWWAAQHVTDRQLQDAESRRLRRARRVQVRQYEQVERHQDRVASRTGQAR